MIELQFGGAFRDPRAPCPEALLPHGNGFPSRSRPGHQGLSSLLGVPRAQVCSVGPRCPKRTAAFSGRGNSPTAQASCSALTCLHSGPGALGTQTTLRSSRPGRWWRDLRQARACGVGGLCSPGGAGSPATGLTLLGDFRNPRSFLSASSLFHAGVGASAGAGGRWPLPGHSDLPASEKGAMAGFHSRPLGRLAGRFGGIRRRPPGSDRAREGPLVPQARVWGPRTRVLRPIS